MKPFASQRYTITAALPYANGPIHVGHLAGAYLPADIYARYLRMRGHDVAFICSSDEGGVAILLRARQEKTTPKHIIDKYHFRNKRAFERWGITFDIFGRTSDHHHHHVAQDFFMTLHKKGIIEERESTQYYDTQEGIFLADRYLCGECPHCHYEEAYGDQCEQCGSALSPEELIAPSSKLSDSEPILKKTTNWYLPLNRYQAFLEKWIATKEGQWKSNVYGQCGSWLKTGLKPRSITRDIGWGIPLPIGTNPQKVLYVWFEAPIGYISATQRWAEKVGKAWEPYWQSPDTKLVHFIGKDNIVFHTLIFPAMLHAHGSYILPDVVCANEFMNLEGKKISTSRNHAIWLDEFLRDHPDKKDSLRYMLATNAPENRDSNFSWSEFVRRNNKELAAQLGNFVKRVIHLVHKYYGGSLPATTTFAHHDQQLVREISSLPEAIGDAIESFQFKKGLNHLMHFARLGNLYLSETAPWNTFKENPAHVQTILNLATQIIGHIAMYGAPYLPFTSEKLMNMLHIPSQAWSDDYHFEKVKAGTSLGEPITLFKQMKEK